MARLKPGPFKTNRVAEFLRREATLAVPHF